MAAARQMPPTIVEASDSEGSASQIDSGLIATGPVAQDLQPRTPAFALGSWNEITVRQPACLSQLLRSFGGLFSFLATFDGRMLLPSTFPLQAGQKIWLWAPGIGDPSAGLALNPEGILIGDHLEASQLNLSASDRLAILVRQRHYLADDQVASSLARIAGACANVQVVDPLLMMKCFQDDDPEPLRALGAAFTRQVVVVSAVPVQGHWVAFAWDLRYLRFRAWDSCPVGLFDVGVSSVHRIWGKVLGFTSSSFCFSQGPARPLAPGLCGHFALAGLWCYLRGLGHASHDEALSLAATLAAAFSIHLQEDKLVRPPLFYGGGAAELVSMGLASLLREKGVPANRATDRAKQAIDRLGVTAVQDAMTAKIPWKALKQLGNNCTPAFQFVLQDELARSIQARAEAQDPAPRKKKVTKARQETGPRQVPVLPQVDDLVVPEGVFASEGRPLCQIDLSSVGANSVGVVLVGPSQAEPYLRLGQPVSQGALALVIVGEVDCSLATIQVQKVRFRAKLAASGEPLLVSGTLAQIGNQWVDKFIPKTTPVDVAESCIARIAVYRDACPVAWEKFVVSPLKEVVGLVPVLQTCDTAGCECQKWHGTSDPGQPPSILETWGRYFYGPTFKPVPPLAATSFQVFLRLPSGLSGVYVEPREDGVRLPSSRYAVVWLPRGTQQEALLLMQTHPSIIGLARIGDRFGVRCCKSEEEQLHHKLRPTTTWVDKARLRVYESGPWPFGTQRSVISRALASFGWQRARPAQPCPGRRGGLWFTIEAEAPPPMDSLHASFGEIIFHEVTARAPIIPNQPSVLASRRTLQGLCPIASAVDRNGADPLQGMDPWQAALDRSAAQRAQAPAPAMTGSTAKQIEQSVLQKIKASQAASSADVLASDSMEASILAKVESRIASAHGELDARINTLDAKVGQVASKVDSQETLLQSLFAEQMSRVEELIGSTKKRRAE